MSFIKYAALGFFGVVCFALGLIVREVLSDPDSGSPQGAFAVEAAGGARDFKLHSDARGWITEALPGQFPGQPGQFPGQQPGQFQPGVGTPQNPG